MKVCIIQPGYSTNYDDTEALFAKELEFLDRCDSSMDIIVMPESTHEPAYAKNKELYDNSVRKYNDAILKKASETAKRCNSILFINAAFEAEKGYRNTTFAYNRQGELVGTYDKEHLTPGEVSVTKLDSDYTFEFTTPTVIEIEGIRFGFLTCYDFYFYENFANLARFDLDVIIGCSHQRSDTHSALEIITRFLAYNTNTHVLRSSVSMGEESEVGGGSMIVTPDGRVLFNMCSRVGMECAEIDINDKYYKPAGFGNPPSAHYQYVEKGRRPWKYRPAGSAIVRHNDIMPYPRVCAHRGFSAALPENSMPAFGAAVAMGADEIEFDVWYTRDKELVVIHDAALDRVSDGHGFVYEHTLDELSKLDFGIKHGERFKDMRILRLEDILKKFSCHVIMNMHIKAVDNHTPYDREIFEKILSLIDKYDCRKYVYFMSSNKSVFDLARELAPDICRCAGAGDDKWKIVEEAIESECQKVQLFKPYLNQEMIDRAHEHGMRCNLFFADDEAEAAKYIEMGIDTILTNDYHRIAQVVKK